MRSQDLGVIPDISKSFSREDSLDIFRKICLSRYFELNVKNAFDQKLIKMPIYLSVGQESVAAALAVAFSGPTIFGQHRGHDLYLSYGGNQQALVDELLHKPTGCAKGMGGSASIHEPTIKMFGHDGLLGTQIPISVGYAIGTNKKTLTVLGDAAVEEDYALGAFGYAAHKKAPMLFVCIDNDLSVLTKTEVRRNWNVADVTRSFGIPSVDITDDPWLIMHHVRKFSGHLPAFINVRVVRHLWHNGTGTDGPPEWDRFAMVKEELAKLGLGEEAVKIEEEVKSSVGSLWNKSMEGTGAKPLSI